MSEAGAAPRSGVWSGDAPLVLASKSASRRALLAACGLEAETLAVDLDERGDEDRYFGAGRPLDRLARELACAKALAASAMRPDAYCLGADQTLTVGPSSCTRPATVSRRRNPWRRSQAGVTG